MLKDNDDIESRVNVSMETRNMFVDSVSEVVQVCVSISYQGTDVSPVVERESVITNA